MSINLNPVRINGSLPFPEPRTKREHPREDLETEGRDLKRRKLETYSSSRAKRSFPMTPPQSSSRVNMTPRVKLSPKRLTLLSPPPPISPLSRSKYKPRFIPKPTIKTHSFGSVSRYKTPDAPKKRNKKQLVSRWHPFSIQTHAAQTGHVVFRNKEFKVSPFAAGAFKQVFRVETTNPAVVSNVQNAAILFKVYLPTQLHKSQNYVEQMTHRQLEQYNKVRQYIPSNATIRVAEIYNEDRVVKDGLFVCEFIPNDLPSLPDGIKFCDLNPHQKALLMQVRQFVDLGFDHKIPLDLHRNNFRMDESGNLVLIDFMEEDETYYLQIMTGVRDWARRDEKIFEFLLENVKQNHLDMYNLVSHKTEPVKLFPTPKSPIKV